MYDREGKAYLDGSSGAVVVNLGHGLPEINEAIQQQLCQVAFAHTSQFVSEPGLRLAEELISLAPVNFRGGGRAYFTSGGSEAVETALKMARSYFFEKGQESRHLTISRWNSYHGSTFGAMAVTGHPARRKPYIPLLKDQLHINPAYPYRCRCGHGPGPCQAPACALASADELESAILKLGPGNVMAFIAEPVVGAALGAAVPGDGYWARIREICTRYGVLLIADEVMVGMGRCGAPFALDLFSVAPDIIVAGKGLAAGYMPLGAVLASSEVVSAFENGSGIFEHGFTYSGHPASCAAGVAALQYLRAHNLIKSVSEREGELFAGLGNFLKYDFVGDIRGRGFLAGMELVRSRATKEPFAPELRVSQMVSRAAADEGLLVYPGGGFVDGLKGDHIIVAPPFNISDAEMELLFEKLDRALASVLSLLRAVK